MLAQVGPPLAGRGILKRDRDSGAPGISRETPILHGLGLMMREFSFLLRGNPARPARCATLNTPADQAPPGKGHEGNRWVSSVPSGLAPARARVSAALRLKPAEIE